MFFTQALPDRRRCTRCGDGWYSAGSGHLDKAYDTRTCRLLMCVRGVCDTLERFDVQRFVSHRSVVHLNCIKIGRPIYFPRLTFHYVPPSVRSDISLYCPSVRPSVCPSVRPFIHPSVRSSVRPSVRPSIRPSVRHFVPICPSVRPSVRLSVRPAVRQFVPICPSVPPSVRQSVHPSCV